MPKLQIAGPLDTGRGALPEIMQNFVFECGPEIWDYLAKFTAWLVQQSSLIPSVCRAHQQDQVSTTDPDATYATKSGTPARLGYYDNYLVDNRSRVIAGVQATAARVSQETVAAKDMIARFAEWQGREPESIVPMPPMATASSCSG